MGFDVHTDWRIGVASIDADHACLFERLRAAETARAEGDISVAAGLLVTFLDRFREHFERETALLERLPEADLLRRRGEFASSLSVVAAHPLDPGDAEQVGRAIGLMRTWLVDHVVRQDLPVAEHFPHAPGDRPAHRRFPFSYDLLGLRWRLGLLGVIVVAVVLGLAAVAFGELAGTMHSVRLLRDMNRLNGEIAAVVHELQTEHALSAMIASNPRLDRTRLREQMLRSDVMLARYRAAEERLLAHLPTGATRDALEGARASLALVPKVRSDVADGAFDAVETTEYYATAIADLMAVVPEVVRTELSSDWGKDTIAYVFLLEAKERAGRERALGAGILAGSVPDMLAGRPENIRTLANDQDAIGHAFETLVPPNVADAYRAAVTVSPALAQMRRSIESRDALGLRVRDWFDVTSERIEKLRAFERRILVEMNHNVDAQEAQALRHAWWIGGGMVVAIVLAVSVLSLLGLSIVPPLRRLAGNVRRLAEGERLLALPDAAGRDEIGDLARSLVHLRDRLIQGDLLEARRGNENAERLRNVMDTLPGVVFRIAVADGAGARVVAVGAKLERLTGLTVAEVVDRPLRDLIRRILSREDRTAFLHLLRRAGIGSLDFELRLDRPGEDRAVWLRVLAAPTRSADGWIWDGVALDVTQVKQAEEEHHRLADELGRLRRTQLANRLGSSFGGEFAALWPRIRAHADEAIAGLSADSPAVDHLAAVIGLTEKMRQLCERLSFPADGRRGAARSIDVAALLETRLAGLAETLPPETVLDLALCDRDARVIGDPAEIDRLVANLLAHLDAAPDETGGRIRIVTRLGAERDGGAGHYLISVTDERGPPRRHGRDRDTAPGLVEPHGARVEALALTLVRTIADGLGGWAQVGRAPSGHELLEIYLPLHPVRADNVVNLEEVARWRTHVR
jgi:PAS domain S-box-containing protein